MKKGFVTHLVTVQKKMSEKQPKRTRRGNKKNKKEVEPVEQPPITWTISTEPDGVADHPTAKDDQRNKEQEMVKTDPELLEYFLNTEKLLEEVQPTFESSDDQFLFIQNVLDQIQSNEASLACDYRCSRLLERLLRLSSDYQVRMFVTRILSSFPDLACHQYASHVCQTVLKLAADIVDREEKGIVGVALDDSQEGDTSAEMASLVLSVCEMLHGSWGELIRVPYGSHVVRTLLNSLSGEALVDESQLRSKRSNKFNSNHNAEWGSENKSQIRLVPDSFKAQLHSISKAIADQLQTNIQSMAVDPVVNPVLQILVKLNGSSDDLAVSFVDSDFGFFMQHDVGSHLVEQIVSRCSQATLDQIYERHVQPDLLNLSHHRVANFVVQRVFERLVSQQHMESALDVLEPHFESMLFSNNKPGVVVRLVQCAIRFPSCQKRLLAAICKAFHLDEAEEKQMLQICGCILNLRTFDKFQVLVPLAQVQGALLVQHIMSFESDNSIVMVKSILSLSPEELVAWATHSISSRILEAFMTSPTVSSKNKRRLTRLLMGNIVAMASDKYASHLIDKIWLVSKMEMKEQIAQEMCEKYSSLSNNFHGKLVLRNCRIELFKQRRDEWVRHEQIRCDGGETKALKKRKVSNNEIDDLFEKVVR